MRMRVIDNNFRSMFNPFAYKYEIKITGPYVSCVGVLCITVSYPNNKKQQPEVYEVVGVDPQDMNFHLASIT